MTRKSPPQQFFAIRSAPLNTVVGTRNGGTTRKEDYATRRAANAAGLTLPTEHNTSIQTTAEAPAAPPPPRRSKATKSIRRGSGAAKPCLDHTTIQSIMDNYARYTYFHEFFSDIIEASEIGKGEFSRRRNVPSDPKFANDTRNYKIGASNPTYAYIEELADKNLLGLTPPPSAGSTDAAAVSNRARLFTVAGLIEVTPENITTFNADLCAGIERNKQKYQRETLPEWLTWNNAVKRLIDFHTQGDRMSYENILQEIGVTKYDRRMLQHVLTGRNNRVAQELKPLLYDFLKLTEDQRALLDSLPCIKPPPYQEKPPNALRSTQDIIVDARRQHASGESIDPYQLFLSLLKASDVRMNRTFKPTDNFPAAKLPQRRGELGPNHFNRSSDTVEKNVREFTDLIIATQLARDHSTLSDDDCNFLQEIAQAHVPEKSVFRKSAIPFQQRIVRAELDPSSRTL